MSTAVAAAISGGALTSVAYAEESVEKLEKIQVTGSRISRVDAEGVAPVTVITREDIEKLGSTTVSDVLRNMTENGGGNYNEAFTNGFAAGSAMTSLRGLGSSRTLTLLNGRRIANYGFAQNVNDTGVDLNSIPLSAVERIEVLKDGASAIYGSDAIAGVINIILRKDFDGVVVTSTVGQTSEGDGEEGQVGVIAGKELENSNILFSFDYFNREASLKSNRDNVASANHSDKGGYDWRSSRSPYPLVVVQEPGKDPVNVCNDPTGNDCRYDYNQVLDLMPATERFGALTMLNHDFNENVSAFAELSFTRVETNNRAAATPDFENRTIAADNKFNTFGQPVQVRARYLDVGPRLNDVTNDSIRVVTGLNGAFEFSGRDVDWETAAGFSQSKVTSDGSNYIDIEKFYDAVEAEQYNPFAPTTNSQAAIDSFRVTTKRESTSEMSFVSGNASMPVMELPAGEVYLALGAEYREESINDKPDPVGAQGGILGSGGTSSKGSRNSKAMYGELSIPVVENVEMQLAARFEKYSDFGTTLDPKVGVRWQPADNLMFRASYSTGFKAPTLPEVFLGESISYVRVTDDVGCEANPGDPNFCGANQYRQRSSGNKDLKAEEAESFNFGVVYEPVDDLELKLDLYKIRNTNVIEQISAQRIVNENPELVERREDGRIDYINNRYINVAMQVVEGADFEAGYSWEMDSGEFGLTYKTSYIHSFKKSNSVGELTDYRGDAGGVGGSGPHLKSKTTLSWDRGDHGVTVANNYTSSYKQPRALVHTKVERLNTIDIQYVYSGLENTKLTFGLDNATNKEAPFSDLDSEGYDMTAHDNRGRFVYGKVEYTF
ncbi:TonB-dependent receptor [Parendozoicomonas haliclonae]|uniref:TonB-dependent receptor n=1 Tax=Parendozoicomonas haliclonae TaxID=1960125 RepID=UPI0013FD4356|nr:TonB-dependent receptor [Parendozoicomonas haliclonae]